MDEGISKKFAIQLLEDDAERIKMLIRNQKNSLCISQCKAFEEVVDTQMYGFSRQVTYATRLGILTNDEGHRLLSDLERELNQLYTDVYEETQEKNEIGVPTEGAEIYVTHFPCLQCTKMILQAGIKKIYYLKDYRNDAYALNLIEQVGATVEKVTLVPKYFAELQWGEEFATLEDNPSSAEE